MEAAKARNAKLGSTKDLPDAPDYGAALVANQQDDEEEDEDGEKPQEPVHDVSTAAAITITDETARTVSARGSKGELVDVTLANQQFAMPSIATVDTDMPEIRTATGLPMRGHVLISALIATSATAGVGGLGRMALAPPTSASPTKMGRGPSHGFS